MLFEDQGIEYEDVRIQREDWPQTKANLVSTGENPFGQLPVVTLGDKTLLQSFAISRYFARIFGNFFLNFISLYVFNIY